MNELDIANKKIEKEVKLKEYKGLDRVIHAEEKRKELQEINKFKPAFRALTGIPTLDNCVDGFRKGQLIVVSGPPKNGKTQVCQTFTKHFVVAGHKCLWFSYEVGYEELFGKFPMDNLDFYIPNFMESGNMEWVTNRVIEAKQKFGTDIVFIDHLDFLRDPEILKGVSLNLSAYVGSIMQKIKRLAIEQDVVIFLMSHIRKNQWTTNALPSSEELRDSGQIAQLADIVLMIIRRRADKGSEEIYLGNEAILGVMENRHNGRTKKINIQLIDKEFKEIDKEHERNEEDNFGGVEGHF